MTRVFTRFLGAAALWLIASLTPLSAAVPVDLELILSVDVSRSMDEDEQRMQRDGYVAAIRHPDVLDAIAHGYHGKIALTYVEWAGPDAQQIIVGWRLIDGEAAAAAFAGELARAPIQRLRGTSIANALAYVAPLFDGNDFDGLRRVVDVSGDGPNNTGIPVELAREQLLSQGITINGLPIMIKRPGGFASIANLDVYYEDCVIGGPGAFLVPVTEASQFAQAIRRKLTLEIAGRVPKVQPASAVAAQKRIDCMIGEKLREQWMRE